MISDFTKKGYYISKECDNVKKFLTTALAVFILLSCVRVNQRVVFRDENISCDGVVRRGLFDSKFYGVVQYKDNGAVITAFDDRTALIIENENIMSVSSLPDFSFQPSVG